MLFGACPVFTTLDPFDGLVGAYMTQCSRQIDTNHQKLIALAGQKLQLVTDGNDEHLGGVGCALYDAWKPAKFES